MVGKYSSDLMFPFVSVSMFEIRERESKHTNLQTQVQAGGVVLTEHIGNQLHTFFQISVWDAMVTS